MIRTSAHLKRHPQSGIFYFRIAVPQHLRAAVGCREIKRSLGTGRKAQALIVAERLIVATRKLFQEAEHSMKSASNQGGFFEKITIQVAGQEVVIDRPDPAEEASIAARLLSLSTPAPAPVAPVPAPTPPPAPVTKKDPSVTISKMVKLYFEEVRLAETQRPKTIEENEKIFQLLIEVLKNRSVTTIGIRESVHFKNVLLQLPPNRTKGHYSGLSVAEILKMQVSTTMSPSSVNKYLRRTSALFSWGMRHGYCFDNPFSGLSIKRTIRPSKLRDRFTIEELRTLFNPANLHPGMRKGYMFWLPWLGLYTGARLEELCQLHLDDIRQENGIWVIDINEKDEKRLKTLASERLIPLHSKLIEIGFIQHVYELNQEGEKRLFPELQSRRDGYGQTASKWFARYRQSLGIENPFHSFRHTFADELKQLGVDYKKVAALLGHTDESMTGGRYGKPFRPDVLQPVVEMLEWDLGVTV